MLGQPGQGKTSFCYQLVGHLLDAPDFDQRLYFIKFRNIPSSQVKELVTAPFKVIAQFLQQEHGLTIRWSQLRRQRLVLVLDGLDELYMKESLTNEDLEELYTNLLEQLYKCSQWHIVLTSRYNYLHPNALRPHQSVILKLAPLSLKQQQEWLRRYQAKELPTQLTPERLKAIHHSIPHMAELLEQPILLHIIALADIDLSSKDNRSTLYERLFDALLDRQWSQQLPKFQKLQKATHKQLFRRWIQSIAFEIYQGNGSYITREHLLELPITKKIQTIIDTHQEQQEALKDLLVAFYFQNVPDKENLKTSSSSYALEFLHKSLQEYLTVAYVLDELQSICTTAPSGTLDQSEKILGLFHKWFATKGWSKSLLSILVDQIKALPLANRQPLQQVLNQSLEFCLQHSFLHHYSIQQTVSPVLQMTHTFGVYWNILARLQPVQNKHLPAKQRHQIPTLCFFLQLAVGTGPLYLCHVDLSGANLNGADLREANLEGTNLSKANLFQADLRIANLQGANLREANLFKADLRVADLRGANLSQADLGGAYLFKADLRKANLTGTDLKTADLTGVQLDQAKVPARNFFQQLERHQCIGVEELLEDYYICSRRHSCTTGSYYLIRKKVHDYLITD